MAEAPGGERLGGSQLAGASLAHGGAKFTPTQNYIFDLERARVGAPGVIPFGITMVAPTRRVNMSSAQVWLRRACYIFTPSGESLADRGDIAATSMHPSDCWPSAVPQKRERIERTPRLGIHSQVQLNSQRAMPTDGKQLV